MKGKQTKNNSKDFRATDSEFWKKHHGYDDKKAEKASDWMSKHYSDLGEAVKINECDIKQLVAESLKNCLNKLNETEYTSLKSKDTRKGKVGVSKDEDDNYYVDYDGKHYHVPSQEDADRWHEILSIDEKKSIVKEEDLPWEHLMSGKKYIGLEKMWLGYAKGFAEKFIKQLEYLTDYMGVFCGYNYCGSDNSGELRKIIYDYLNSLVDESIDSDCIYPDTRSYDNFHEELNSMYDDEENPDDDDY